MDLEVNNNNLNKILSNNRNLEESISNLPGLKLFNSLKGLKLRFELLPGQYKRLHGPQPGLHLGPQPGPHLGPQPGPHLGPLPGLKLLCPLQDLLNQGLLSVQMFNLFQIKIDPNQFQLSVAQHKSLYNKQLN
jgi:hypothetical protein